MILYLIGNNGYYQGTMEYPDDPNNQYGIPYGTTVKSPPTLELGQYAVWGGTDWYATYNPPPAERPVVPESITKYQAKMILLQYGLYEQVEEFVKNSTDNALKISWYDAVNFHRNNSFVDSIAAQFGLTSDQIDEMFILAEKI